MPGLSGLLFLWRLHDRYPLFWPGIHSQKSLFHSFQLFPIFFREFWMFFHMSSAAPYLPLAMKYRRKTRSVARRIPLDILPLKSPTSDDPFLADVAKGEVVYER